MKFAREFVANTLIGGALVVLPLYLAVLLLLKGMQAVAGLVRPVARLLPQWMPAENILALLLVLVVCFVVGLAVRTRAGRTIRARMEVSVFGKMPGYTMIRGLTQRMAGEASENVWKPALVEIEDALVPAFIIEEHDDGQLDGLRSLRADAVCRSGVHLERSTSPSHRCALRAGHSIDLEMGIWIEGPGRGDGKCRTRERDLSGASVGAGCGFQRPRRGRREYAAAARWITYKAVRLQRRHLLSMQQLRLKTEIRANRR